jgi:hypothetical protein
MLELCYQRWLCSIIQSNYQHSLGSTLLVVGILDDIHDVTYIRLATNAFAALIVVLQEQYSLYNKPLGEIIQLDKFDLRYLF